MSEQQRVAVIRNIYEAFARGDLSYILDQLDPGVEWHAPSTVPWSKGLHRGPGEVAQFFAGIAENIAGPRVQMDEFLPAGDRVVALGCFSGRVQSGESFEAAEAHVWTFSERKIVEYRVYADTAAMLQAVTAPVSPALASEMGRSTDARRALPSDPPPTSTTTTRR